MSVCLAKSEICSAKSILPRNRSMSSSGLFGEKARDWTPQHQQTLSRQTQVYRTLPVDNDPRVTL